MDIKVLSTQARVLRPVTFPAVKLHRSGRSCRVSARASRPIGAASRSALPRQISCAPDREEYEDWSPFVFCLLCLTGFVRSSLRSVLKFHRQAGGPPQRLYRLILGGGFSIVMTDTHLPGKVPGCEMTMGRINSAGEGAGPREMSIASFSRKIDSATGCLALFQLCGRLGAGESRRYSGRKLCESVGLRP